MDKFGVESGKRRRGTLTTVSFEGWNIVFGGFWVGVKMCVFS
jgi:hypothetical protein